MNADGGYLVISRMQQAHLVIDEIQALSRQQAAVYEASLEPFSPHFDKLLSQFPSEFDKYRLDEVVVAAIVPIVRAIAARELREYLDALLRCGGCFRGGTRLRIPPSYFRHSGSGDEPLNLQTVRSGHQTPGWVCSEAPPSLCPHQRWRYR